MEPGKLNKRVSFQDPAPEQDSDGNLVENWINAFPQPIPAQILPLNGREFIAAQSTQSKVTGKMRVRFHERFKAGQRGVCRGTIYNIEAVIPDSESGRHSLFLLYSTGVSEGQ